MSTISPLSPHLYQFGSLTAASPQTDNKNLRTGNASPQVKAQDDLVSLSKGGVDLQQRIDRLGNATVDYAQSLLGNFAQQLFGDAGKGATISFDSVELGASSTFAAGVQHSEDAKGSTDAAALSLNESAHFLGKGSITTADGRKFDFEVEIQYDHTLQTGASQTQAPATSSPIAASDSNGIAPRSAADPLPPVEFPDIKFPGTLQDLFRLFDKPIKTDVVQNNDAQQGGQQKLGTLSLRLLHLVSSTASLDLYVANRNKAASEAYGQQDSTDKAPVTTPAPAAAPATTAPVGATGVANTDTQQASRAAKADTAAVA
jgi:hypothetical protein